MNDKNQQATEQKTVLVQFHGELQSWQTKIDEAKLQMHLGTKEVEQKIQPYVEQLEQDLTQAKEDWEQLADASEGAWKDIQSGVSNSIKSMQMAFENAKKHFPDEDKK